MRFKHFINVLFPAPLGPRKPNTQFLSIEKLSLSTALKLPYIFEEFYRGDESRNKKEGNGLGLYIVKYLAGAMGGSVRAENADGFEVCLKLPISGKGEAEDNGKQ